MMSPPVQSVQMVRLGDVVPQPWKNGGGTTRELLAWPQPEAWLVRVSVARISRDGPFSSFPGVMRWFTVLRGAGVSLEWPDRTRMLTRGDEGTMFSGDDAPHCRLLDGDTDDLNVMWSQSVRTHGVTRVVPGAPWRSAASWRAVYVDAPCTLVIGDGTHCPPLTLDAGSLAWMELSRAADAELEPWKILTPVPVRAWWIWANPSDTER